jgi:O-methyltransferase
MFRSFLHKSLRAVGFDVVRLSSISCPPDFLPEEVDTVEKVRPWTLTSSERIYALIQAVKYLENNAIPGAIVECGVWKGGSMAAIARTLVRLRATNRELYLFDTFEGMSQPTEKDVDYSGHRASEILIAQPQYYCNDAPIDTVKGVLNATGYPRERMHFVQGKVEETLPTLAPEVISLLRLDTDWYESTKHELFHLFPRLSSRGVVIIDDYGHWEGARRACDEYFSENRVNILLNRIDYTGRIAVKL